VTNAQYADFLNAKAAGDPLGLYDASMDSDSRGGIIQSGVSGGFTYATKTNMADKPVNFVSWYDSIRFANWLNNGQGTGSTETGTCTLLGGTATPGNGQSISRNGGAMWFVTGESEWYKAAYYQPAVRGAMWTTTGSIPRRAIRRLRPPRPTAWATSVIQERTSPTSPKGRFGTASSMRRRSAAPDR